MPNKPATDNYAIIYIKISEWRPAVNHMTVFNLKDIG